MVFKEEKTVLKMYQFLHDIDSLTVDNGFLFSLQIGIQASAQETRIKKLNEKTKKW